MTRILHISDTHFGTVLVEVEQALLTLAKKLQPDIIVLSGDITQRARRSQFAAASDFIKALPAPVLAVPGNHDIPLFNLVARSLWPYANYRRAINRNLAPEYETDQLLLLGVNSSRPKRHVDGELSSKQIQYISHRLSAASANQLKVVTFHHPVRAVEEKDIDNLVHGHEKAVSTWVDAGLDLLLAGHIHLPYVHKLSGAERYGWTAQAGTALSWRLRDQQANSVNVIEHRLQSDHHQCHIQRWDFQANSEQFVCCHEQPLALSRE